MASRLFLLHDIVFSLRDFLFPKVCPGCDNPIEDGCELCSACRDRIRMESRQWRPTRDLPGIDRVSVLLPYDEFTRNLVHALKYHGARGLGVPLGSLMAEKMSRETTLGPDIVIVPVPLHPEKKRERGYNQCELLAKGFASASGLTVENGAIDRARYTGTQTALDAETRKTNVQGAFRIAREGVLAGKRAIVIDDVLTTGSTMAECARVLREAGAVEIMACVVSTPSIRDS